MYAVIETGSKQYRVEVGTQLEVELLDVEPGQTITLDRVLLVADGETSAIGRPIVDGAKVTAEVLRRERGVKTISFKYRPKARRRVKKGHRQELTILRVEDIVLGGKSAAAEVRAAELAAKTERERLEEAAARQAAEDAALAAKLAKAAAPKEDAEASKAKGGASKKATAAATKAADAKAESKPGKATAKATAKAPAAKTAARAETAKPDKSAKSSAAAKKAPPTKKDK
ncbi:MAG TPA: 50S ribosomal protein L21 [Candidatus Limnocylindrales bacterium]